MFLITYNRQNPDLICFPFLLRHPHEMLRADIAKRRHLAFFRMMKTETAFLHHAPGFHVAVIIPAPDGGHFQILKTPSQQAAHGFRYQSLPPIRHAYPIAYFRLARSHFSTMQTVSEHDTYATYRLVRCFQYHRIRFGSGKHRADYFQALRCRSMRRPARNRTDGRVFGVFVQGLRIRFPPRAENQSQSSQLMSRFLFHCTNC